MDWTLGRAGAGGQARGYSVMVDSHARGVALVAQFCDGLAMIKQIAFTFAVALSAVPLTAQGADDGVPYWVSTAKDTANMRVGPGREYRINWTYVRKGVPLKVLRVMGSWRLVEDPQGARGWILSQFLTRARAGIVKDSITRSAREEGRQRPHPVARGPRRDRQDRRVRGKLVRVRGERAQGLCPGGQRLGRRNSLNKLCFSLAKATVANPPPAPPLREGSETY